MTACGPADPSCRRLRAGEQLLGRECCLWPLQAQVVTASAQNSSRRCVCTPGRAPKSPEGMDLRSLMLINNAAALMEVAGQAAAARGGAADLGKEGVLTILSVPASVVCI